jgi:hypothetical protein
MVPDVYFAVFVDVTSRQLDCDPKALPVNAGRAELDISIGILRLPY